MNTLYAHGKLLISAEYMVLFGSKALAVPLQLGQSLQRLRTENRSIFTWKALYKDQPWFHASYDSSTLKILESSDQNKASALKQMIQACFELLPTFQEELFKLDVETQLDFDPDWGLGSSSTLIALLAEWAEVNPLDLHFLVSDGSGYDVACAIANGPIVYRLRDDAPQYQHISFAPPFSDQLYFVWLGNKQPTAPHLREMTASLNPDYEMIHRYSCFTEEMANATDPLVFREIMSEHDAVLSQLLGIESISATRFRDLPGAVKSLGAWGGDFVMICSEVEEKELYNYLHSKEFEVIYRYSDLVYDENKE
jgi:mevalonate kinase